MKDFDSNLPVKATKILIGQKYAAILAGPLKDLGIEIITVPDNASLSESISSHADLSVFYAGNRTFFLNNSLKDTDLSKTLARLDYTVLYSSREVSGVFPNDVALNICKFGKNIIYSSKYSDISVIKHLISNNFIMIDSKQAYCRCSTAIVNENSIITADTGIAAQLSKRGINTLRIEPGYFFLKGYNYGFIGGSSFKISKDIIAFTGHLNMHPDKNRILDFLAENSVKPVFLTDNPAFDIGSGIPLV